MIEVFPRCVHPLCDTSTGLTYNPTYQPPDCYLTRRPCCRSLAGPLFVFYRNILCYRTMLCSAITLGFRLRLLFVCGGYRASIRHSSL